MGFPAREFPPTDSWLVNAWGQSGLRAETGAVLRSRPSTQPRRRPDLTLSSVKGYESGVSKVKKGNSGLNEYQVANAEKAALDTGVKSLPQVPTDFGPSPEITL